MIPTNQYGNVDVAHLPPELVHIDGLRLAPTCRAKGIDFAPAMVGFRKAGGRYFPVIRGVVIAKTDQERLAAALAAKERRNTPERIAQREAARKRKQEREIAAIAAEIRQRFPNLPEGEEMEIARHGWEVGSGRVGRSSTAEDPIYAAVVAHIRHEHTEYDEMLEDGFDRDFARSLVRKEIDEILSKWEANPELISQENK